MAGHATEILRSARLVTITAAVTLLAVHLANEVVAVSELLDANAEGTLWTWASVLATGGVAIAAALGGLLIKRRRLGFWLLAALAAFLSLDDLTVLHERIAIRAIDALGLPGTWDSIVWPALYLPLIAATAVLAYRLTGERSAEMQRTVIWGLGLLAAAVVAEVLSAPWSDPDSADTLVHVIEGGVEEAAELAGWILVAGAVFARVVDELVATEVGAHGGFPAARSGDDSDGGSAASADV